MRTGTKVYFPQMEEISSALILLSRNTEYRHPLVPLILRRQSLDEGGMSNESYVDFSPVIELRWLNFAFLPFLLRVGTAGGRVALGRRPAPPGRSAAAPGRERR